MPNKAVPDSIHQHSAFERRAVLRIGIAVLAAAAVWFRLWEPFPAVSVIGALALAFAGWPIFREAFANLLARRMTMELSMTIAIVAAAAISEWFTALVVTLFVLLAEELEHMTIARGRMAILDLVNFVPREARVRRDGEVVTLPLAEVVPGDIVVVSPGEKVPVDGEVVSGHSYVDQSRLTGESMPAAKDVGAAVFAGSINQLGLLEIATRQVGPDTSYGRIIQAVEAAEHTRAPVQKLADQLAGYLVYVALVCAALTFLITRDIRDTISVIIVAGACGIAAGTPLAILGGIGRAARLGSIIKGGIHLETLGKVDTIVFDKTGTLTIGEPVVTRLDAAAGIDETELLRLAAIAEFHSEHPLARAVIREAEARGIAATEPDDFRYTVARGINATHAGRMILVGNRKLLAEAGVAVPEDGGSQEGSEILVAADGRYMGAVTVADPLRPEATHAVARLNDLGLRTVLLTGDVARVGQKVGARLGIAEVKSDLMPEDKHRLVRAMTARKRIVAMIGDGVNDAPALTAASVGVAMGSGTDIAQESADIVLIGNDLNKLVETVLIARQTRRIIWQNFTGTLVIDAVGIGLAAFGLLNPLVAAAIHVGSELAFILNSARLLALKAQPSAKKPKEKQDLAPATS
ncbi:MAG: cadmium-translocating P-type ATPase [Methylobacterium sp.]|nr:cadmium-translocating P-type ATPase [Methylobacterium sp.]MCA3655615.1 cadmium-translocating P-type ATPase [Methylobacterium sp.]MCA3656736.1 cadmium-translocating P-type ATPase [Methylobacterium sp.]MCA3661139.1 cadmium-translocating P-type ATPase [Methylobacterium sp.]MCA3664659.1 cadmium-translocating P-type ATPase [Methylobacterium sp.]